MTTHRPDRSRWLTDVPLSTMRPNRIAAFMYRTRRQQNVGRPVAVAMATAAAVTVT
jgi:hypothetical protein